MASSGTGSGLGAAVKLVVKSFLEQRHYRMLHRTLAEMWKDAHALSAAVRLMGAHGVVLTPDEEERIMTFGEERMIDVLVSKMPQQSREQFDHFFLQLSLIASTTTRLRSALETGNAKVIEEVLESAENVGILSFMMKMAVTQAGQEVLAHEGNHDKWLSTTDTKMGPLLRGQADAMVSQKALAQARSKLAGSTADAKEKSKKVLMGLTNGQAMAAAAGAFNAWSALVKRMKRELEVRAEYAEEIEAAQQRLMDYKSKQLAGVKNVLSKQANGKKCSLVVSAIAALKAEVEEYKYEISAKDHIAAQEAKLKAMGETGAANAKKVLTRMNGGNEQGLIMMAFQAFVQYHTDYKKNLELEEAVKASEAKVAEFMKKQNEGAKSVLNRMSAGSDSGLLAMVFKAWKEDFEEQKKQEALQGVLEAGASKMSMFSSKNKLSALGVMQKMADAQDMTLLIQCFNNWKKEAKVQCMKRYGKEKNEKRKQQLQGVKGLFKNFASELEQGLKEGTPRVEIKKKKEPTSP